MAPTHVLGTKQKLTVETQMFAFFPLCKTQLEFLKRACKGLREQQRHKHDNEAESGEVFQVMKANMPERLPADTNDDGHQICRVSQMFMWRTHPAMGSLGCLPGLCSS